MLDRPSCSFTYGDQGG